MVSCKKITYRGLSDCLNRFQKEEIIIDKQLIDLCRDLDMPQSISNELAVADTEPLLKFIDSLLSGDLGQEGYNKITAAIGEDPRGIKMLALQLKAALQSREMYAKQNISDQIFIATMKCFPRFVQEYMWKTGHLGFNTGWWSWRHLSLKLFRLGVLEFECNERKAVKTLSVHIPSDALMSREGLDASYRWAVEFFTFYDYEYIYCDTWLLAPVLKDMLPKGSRILDFMSDYDIEEVNPEGTSFMEFLYKKEYPDIDSLPEDSSLRRAVKRHLQAGGKVGEAFGRYRKCF